MRVVVSVGGSVLVPDPATNRVAEYAAVIEGLVESGHEIAAVVGGGGVAREYIGAAREVGANESELDQLGIAVTRLNSKLLLAALDESITASVVPENYEQARTDVQRGDVTVMGGVVPAQTTDAVAAVLAEYVDADRLVFATSVPGVFTADPNEVEDAERHDVLTASELVDTVASMEMTAGASAPVDLLATKVIQRAGLETVVLDGADPTRVTDAVENDEFDGTRIVPDAEAE
ncbi:UMP kinase [Halosegnis longus]|uniref:Uridylate kinase n=1 Tax=Halosegnis longus TaxID=2216012 RepID=A0AAJ4RAC9_9EURY|nr:UMP kinase [Salella cibi]